MNKQTKNTMKKKSEEKKRSKEAIIPAGTFVKWALFLCFIVLIGLFFIDYNPTVILSIMLISMLASVIYATIYKNLIFSTVNGEKVGRFILSYISTIIVVFFYAFAMIRSNQMNDVVRIIICLSSFFVFYCINTAARGLLRKIPDSNPLAKNK